MAITNKIIYDKLLEIEKMLQIIIHNERVKMEIYAMPENEILSWAKEQVKDANKQETK
jgi:hypothetical protein